MRHDRLKKAVEKYSAVHKVEGRNDQFYSDFFGKMILWSTRSFDPSEVCVVRVRRKSDQDEIISDYSAGEFHDTIKSAIKDFISGLLEAETIEQDKLFAVLEEFKISPTENQNQWVKNMLNTHEGEKE